MSENRFCYCPHCHTVFRLSGENPQHQSIFFRCCVCREVFDSSANRISETAPEFVSGDGRDPAREGPRAGDGFIQVDDPADDQVDDPADDPADDQVDDREAEKPPAQAVLEEAPLAWMRENTAHEYIKDRSKPLITVVWCIACVGLLALLTLQIKYFYVEKFAQDQSLRKYLSGFCKIARCELPPFESPDLFTIADTKIDLHPNHPDALRVAVKLINQAGHSQPYPDLQITLTDQAGRVVGRRSFSPQAYLAAGAENMVGGGERVSLLFELARPHEKAVGFAVHVVTE